MERFWGDYRWGGEKWSTKVAISLKRVKIEEKLPWRAYRNSPTLFWTVPSLTPYGLPFPKIGVRTPPQTSFNRYYITNEYKAMDFKFGMYIHRVHLNKSLRNFFYRKRSVSVSRDCPRFLGTLYYLRKGRSYGFQIGPVHSQGPSEQKPTKIWRKGSMGVSSDCQFFFG